MISVFLLYFSSSTWNTQWCGSLQEWTTITRHQIKEKQHCTARDIKLTTQLRSCKQPHSSSTLCSFMYFLFSFVFRTKNPFSFCFCSFWPCFCFCSSCLSWLLLLLYGFLPSYECDLYFAQGYLTLRTIVSLLSTMYKIFSAESLDNPRSSQ